MASTLSVKSANASISSAQETSAAYGWYVVFVLMLCYTLSFVDRQILSLLVGPIKHALRLTDTRVGLLQGLAFAVFYAFLGFPLGGSPIAATGEISSLPVFSCGVS